MGGRAAAWRRDGAGLKYLSPLKKPFLRSLCTFLPLRLCNACLSLSASASAATRGGFSRAAWLATLALPVRNIPTLAGWAAGGDKQAWWRRRTAAPAAACKRRLQSLLLGETARGRACTACAFRLPYCLQRRTWRTTEGRAGSVYSWRFAPTPMPHLCFAARNEPWNGKGGQHSGIVC